MVKREEILELIAQLQKGYIGVEDFTEKIFGKKDSYVNIDSERSERLGFDEVVFGRSKSVEQLLEIIDIYKKNKISFLCTKLTKGKIDEIMKIHSDLEAFYEAGIIRSGKKLNRLKGEVAIVSAGLSDLSVALESSVVLDTIGVNNKIFSDVGVAGVHRFFKVKDEIDRYDVIIVIAGMEGALPSLVGGLFPQPVIAVPTSVGYGTALNGFTALFAMLTSCANGITVVNIDNGFGAALAAYRIINSFYKNGTFSK
ncbi:MAG: nickel pincer cofactor biosynthesis protein LarB [Deferribacterales bacterium]